MVACAIAIKVFDMISKAPQRNLVIAYSLIAIITLGARWLSWPGFATQDTIFVTNEAIVGQYTTYHPLLSLLLIKFLAVPFNSFAVYTSIQMMLAAAMLMRSLALTEPPGDSWRAVASVIIWGVSLHTWLYMGMMWKDVLIAYSLIFLTAFVYRMRHSNSISLSKIDAVLFALALVFATKLRHGMEYNLFLVPVFVGLTNVISIKRLRYAYFVALVAAASLTFLASSNFVRHDKEQEKHDLLLRLTIASQPFLAIVTNRNGYSTDDESYDQQLAEHVFGSYYKMDYAADYYNNEIVLSDARDLNGALNAIIARTPRLCLLNLALCISDRFKMMFSTFQPATQRGGMVFYDLGLLPCSAWRDLSEPMCNILVEYESEEKPQLASQITASAIDKFVSRPGWIRNLYAWNLFPSFIFLCAVLIFLGPNYRLWWASIFFAGQLVLPFATAPVNDFRYYYFLPFYFYVFAPLVFVRIGAALRNHRRKPVTVSSKATR